MLFSKVFLAAATVSSALAAPAHQHNQHKRDADAAVVQVTQIHTVVVTAGAPPAAPPAAQPTPVVSSEPAAQPTPEVQPTTASSSSAPPASTGGSSSGSFNPTGKGVTYSPYAADGQCKDLAAVQADLANLKDYEIIRLYGVDCTQVENVLQSKADGQKLFLGIFFMDQIEAGCQQIGSAVKQYGSWDDIHTISVGNELVNNGAATVDQIAGYVSTARSALQGQGYNGPVVSVDTHVAILNNPGLCSISDYTAFNAHAYFDYNTEASGAGAWLSDVINRVKQTCGKDALVTETGWPHQGNTYGQAVASPEAQSAAISSIKSTVPDSVILFNAYDDLWKQDGSLNCEKYWGIN